LEPDRTLLPDVINSLPGIQPKSAASVSIESLPEATQRALIIEKIRTGADRDAIRILEVSESAVRILEEARKLCVSTLSGLALVLEPDSVSNTSFANLQFVGYVPEGPGLDTTRLSRMFRDDRGALIMLTEWNYKAAGGGIVSFKEFQNHVVNRVPAALALLRAPSGAALWKLAWTTEKKDYELYVFEPEMVSGQLSVRESVVLEYARSLGQ